MDEDEKFLRAVDKKEMDKIASMPPDEQFVYVRGQKQLQQLERFKAAKKPRTELQELAFKTKCVPKLAEKCAERKRLKELAMNSNSEAKTNITSVTTPVETQSVPIQMEIAAPTIPVVKPKGKGKKWTFELRQGSDSEEEVVVKEKPRKTPKPKESSSEESEEEVVERRPRKKNQRQVTIEEPPLKSKKKHHSSRVYESEESESEDEDDYLEEKRYRQQQRHEARLKMSSHPVTQAEEYQRPPQRSLFKFV